MRAAFHIAAFFITDTQHLDGQIPAVRLHNFNRFANREFIFLFKSVHSLTVLSIDNAKISIFLNISIAVINLGLMSRFAKEEACRKLSVSAFGNLFTIERKVLSVKF